MEETLTWKVPHHAYRTDSVLLEAQLPSRDRKIREISFSIVSVSLICILDLLSLN